MTPEVIENSDSYDKNKFKDNYTYDGKIYDIYFLKNASTGEVLYAAQNGDTAVIDFTGFIGDDAFDSADENTLFLLKADSCKLTDFFAIIRLPCVFLV